MPPSLGSARATARADLVRSRIGHEIGEAVSVEVAADYGDMIGILQAGAAHLVWAPTGVCARLRDPRSVLVAVRRGRSTYRSAVITRRDRQLDLASLRGARAAWVDRASVGGYRLAVHALLHHGIDASRVLSREDFVGSYPAVVDAVLSGAADLGAVFVPSDDPEVVERALEEHRAGRGPHALHALLVSAPVPNDVFAITDAVSVERARAIEARLFPTTPKGAITPGRPASLCLAMEVDGFERVSSAALAALRAMLAG
jgi:phosphonate transport system substrate-binding protein